jgi:hypothetical protein
MLGTSMIAFTTPLALGCGVFALRREGKRPVVITSLIIASLEFLFVIGGLALWTWYLFTL